MAGTLLDLFDRLPSRWRPGLQDLERQFHGIESKITSQDRWERRITPSPELIFSVFEMPPEEVRVVIVGQDPYPNRAHATGRAFAVNPLVSPLPGSLRNIMREKISDVGGQAPAPDLLEWHDQGVMLLNTVLTGEEGVVNAHRGIGWEVIVERVIQIAVSHGAVGLLWGKSALRFKSIFQSQVITGVHPSPLSAHRGFFGSKPFSAVNSLLEQPISW